MANYVPKTILHDCFHLNGLREYTEQKFIQHLMDHHGYPKQLASDELENIKKRNKELHEQLQERIKHKQQLRKQNGNLHPTQKA